MRLSQFLMVLAFHAVLIGTPSDAYACFCSPPPCGALPAMEPIFEATIKSIATDKSAVFWNKSIYLSDCSKPTRRPAGRNCLYSWRL